MEFWARDARAAEVLPLGSAWICRFGNVSCVSIPIDISESYLLCAAAVVPNYRECACSNHGVPTVTQDSFTVPTWFGLRQGRRSARSIWRRDKCGWQPWLSPAWRECHYFEKRHVAAVKRGRSSPATFLPRGPACQAAYNSQCHPDDAGTGCNHTRSGSTLDPCIAASVVGSEVASHSISPSRVARIPKITKLRARSGSTGLGWWLIDSLPFW